MERKGEKERGRKIGRGGDGEGSEGKEGKRGETWKGK